MEIVNYSELRNNLAAQLDNVIENRTPVIVTRANKKPVVMIPLDDFNSYEETTYLLKTKKNEARLLQAVEDVENQKYVIKDLFE